MGKLPNENISAHHLAVAKTPKVNMQLSNAF